MFEKLLKVADPEEILQEVAFPKALAEIKAQRDKTLKDIIAGRDARLMLIIGPCSAHDPDAVVEYVSRLGKIQERVQDKIVLVPRIYTNKPRTKGVGYKGIFSQPDPDKDPNIQKGIYELRKMHIHAVECSGLTAADEMLYPENYAYVEDLLSYVAVGARSVEDQQHRLVCSGIDIPVGMKNPMSGSLLSQINSIYATQSSQVFKYHQFQVKTSGNEYAHAVLRGSEDKNGKSCSNYHYEDLMELIELYQGAALKNPAVIIDSNHSNSGKRYKEQIRIVNDVLLSASYEPEIKKVLKGFMIESYLVEGAQKTNTVFGQSITDPCIGWEDTENLIYTVAEKW